MFLGEPERTQADVYFNLFGIPVRVHPFFWLVAVILGANLIQSPIDLVVWILAVFTAILVHELGHALVMRSFGFRPSITLYGLGGVASYDRFWVAGGWGNSAGGQILISAAGPGISLALAAGIVAVVGFTGHPVQVFLGLPYGLAVVFSIGVSEILNQFLLLLVGVLIAWSFLNLLPIYPLDGGQIARELLLLVNPRQGIVQSLILSVVTAGGLCVVGLVVWKSWFLAILFGYLAFANFMTLQAYRGRSSGW